MKEYKLTKNTKTTIGRSSKNTIQINDSKTSSHHAFIEASDNEVILTDNNSKNGTFVNGKKIDKHRLKKGDEIVIGRVSIKLENSRLKSDDERFWISEPIDNLKPDNTNSNSHQDMQQFHPQPKETSIKNNKILIAGLAVAVLVIGVAVGSILKIDRGGLEKSLKVDKTYYNNGDVLGYTKNGASIYVPGVNGLGDCDIKISESKRYDDMFGKDVSVNAYDFNVDDKHEFNSPLQLSIPYDASFIEPGQNIEECIQAGYINESTNSIEPVTYQVDQQNQRVIVATNHLSHFLTLTYRTRNVYRYIKYTGGDVSFRISATKTKVNTGETIKFKPVPLLDGYEYLWTINDNLHRQPTIDFAYGQPGSDTVKLEVVSVGSNSIVDRDTVKITILDNQFDSGNNTNWGDDNDWDDDSSHDFKIVVDKTVVKPHEIVTFTVQPLKERYEYHWTINGVKRVDQVIQFEYIQPGVDDVVLEVVSQENRVVCVDKVRITIDPDAPSNNVPDTPGNNDPQDTEIAVDGIVVDSSGIVVNQYSTFILSPSPMLAGYDYKWTVNGRVEIDNILEFEYTQPGFDEITLDIAKADTGNFERCDKIKVTILEYSGN